MERIAILSKHIILPASSNSSSHLPQFGIILIHDECIQEIILISSDTDLDSVLSSLTSWNIQDYTDYYISPAIIDLNVRKEWEDYSSLTRMAVSGGVCCILEEPGVYHNQEESMKDLYCDIAKSTLVNRENWQDIHHIVTDDVFAVKGYLYPLSSNSCGLPENLEEVANSVNRLGVPLMIDSLYTEPRMLYMASPCRHISIEDRLDTELSEDTNMGGGAFPDIIKSYDSYGNEDFLNINSHTKQNRSLDENTYAHLKVSFSLGDLYEFHNSSYSNLSSKPNRSITLDIDKPYSYNIYDDLEKRVNRLEANIECLSMAEQFLYSEAGSTSFISAFSQTKSNSYDESCVRTCSSDAGFLSVPNSAGSSAASIFKTRTKDKRPSKLSITRSQTESIPNKHLLYTNFLAHCPDLWELSGVKRVLNSLKDSNHKVHFCNLSSAKAIQEVWKYKRNHGSNITVETCPHYLYYTDLDVGEGETHMKDFPPIRSANNKTMLWEQLKMNEIDIISSRHASIPHMYKNIDQGSFKKALNGINCLGFSLQVIWTQLMSTIQDQSQIEHYLIRMSKWMSQAPAKLLAIEHKRGSISVGKYADLIIWSPYEKAAGNVFSSHPQTCIYQNQPLYGRIHTVYIRGKVALNENKFYNIGEVQYRRNYIE